MGTISHDDTLIVRMKRNEGVMLMRCSSMRLKGCRYIHLQLINLSVLPKLLVSTLTSDSFLTVCLRFQFLLIRSSILLLKSALQVFNSNIY